MHAVHHIQVEHSVLNKAADTTSQSVLSPYHHPATWILYLVVPLCDCVGHMLPQPVAPSCPHLAKFAAVRLSQVAPCRVCAARITRCDSPYVPQCLLKLLHVAAILQPDAMRLWLPYRWPIACKCMCMPLQRLASLQLGHPCSGVACGTHGAACVCACWPQRWAMCRLHAAVPRCSEITTQCASLSLFWTRGKRGVEILGIWQRRRPRSVPSGYRMMRYSKQASCSC
jgi:hypothetical protein